jgi:hypothetical protein
MSKNLVNIYLVQQKRYVGLALECFSNDIVYFILSMLSSYGYKWASGRSVGDWIPKATGDRCRITIYIHDIDNVTYSYEYYMMHENLNHIQVGSLETAFQIFHDNIIPN